MKNNHKSENELSQPAYFYRAKITTWSDQDDEPLTVTAEFKSHDLVESQKRAFNYWNKQMNAFFRGEIMLGFLGPLDSEGNPWDWQDSVEAEILFVEQSEGKEQEYILGGSEDHINRLGQEVERFVLQTFGFANEGMFNNSI